MNLNKLMENNLIINRTSDSDLLKLGKKLGIHNLVVCAKSKVKGYLANPKVSNIIFNMSNSNTGGTHWCYYSPKYNVYFDSYAQDMPSILPKKTKLASTYKQIQSMESQDCGSLCCLFAYYLNYKSKDEYYKLFKDVYPGI